MAALDFTDVTNIYNLLNAPHPPAGDDVAYLCSNRHGMINKFSKAKPIRIAPYKDTPKSTAELLLDSEDNFKYGVRVYCTSAEEVHSMGFEYHPPIPGKHWCRLSDFYGYDHSAVPFPAVIADWDDPDEPINLAEGMAFATEFRLAQTENNANGINIFECMFGSAWTLQSGSVYPVILVSDPEMTVIWGRAMCDLDSDFSPLDLTTTASQWFYAPMSEDGYEQFDIPDKSGLVPEARAFLDTNSERVVSIAFITVNPNSLTVEVDETPLDLTKWCRLDLLEDSGIGVPFYPVPFHIGRQISTIGTWGDDTVPGVVVSYAETNESGISILANLTVPEVFVQRAITFTLLDGGVVVKAWTEVYGTDNPEFLPAEYTFVYDWSWFGYLSAPASDALSLDWVSYKGDTPEYEVYRHGRIKLEPVSSSAT